MKQSHMQEYIPTQQVTSGYLHKGYTLGKLNEHKKIHIDGKQLCVLCGRSSYRRNLLAHKQQCGKNLRDIQKEWGCLHVGNFSLTKGVLLNI